VKTVQFSKKQREAIKLIAFILKCGHEHSDDPDAWGVPGKAPWNDRLESEDQIRPQAFYYAYSHLSYVCACIWTKASGEPTDAETFTDLLYNMPNDVEQAVINILTSGGHLVG
jgi:hypothetical protein